MKHKILLIGAGGHCKVILDVLLQIKGYEVAGIIDIKENLGTKVFGVSVMGTDADLPHFFKSDIKHCFISVGSVGNPHLRIKLFNLAKKLGFVFPNLISPAAKVSANVILGEGNYIAPGVIINAGTQIGNNCIINTGVIIEHDCKIGNFVHLSPGSILSGGVLVENYTHIGTGSVVIQDLVIGEDVIVGVGSVVTKNIRKELVAYGNPCKERKDNV